MELRDDPRNSLNRPDVVLRKWHFGYAVSSGEASESHLPCSSVAQWRAEHGWDMLRHVETCWDMLRHVETAVPGSTGRLFWVVRFSDYPRLFLETRHPWRGLRFSRFFWCRRLQIRPVKRRLVRRRARRWCSSVTETWIKHIIIFCFYIFFIYFQTKQTLGDPRWLKLIEDLRRSYLRKKHVRF